MLESREKDKMLLTTDISRSESAKLITDHISETDKKVKPQNHNTKKSAITGQLHVHRTPAGESFSAGKNVAHFESCFSANVQVHRVSADAYIFDSIGKFLYMAK